MLAALFLWIGIAAVGYAQAPELPKSWGERHSRHHEVKAWFEECAMKSPRARFLTFGKSVEGRDLFLSIVSSEANLARLDALLAQSRDLESGRLAEDLPVTVWLGYSVHGSEPSGTEAALKVMNHLLTRDDEETRQLLANLLVIVEPLMNPDGRDRFVNYYEDFAGRAPTPDPAAMEHNQDWPSGRMNHYLFDLNRDWIGFTQAENRARIVEMRRLRPQVFVDHHEMGTNHSYFFPPSAPPLNRWIPEHANRWSATFGASIAGVFDAHAWAYWTEEIYDGFYPGYGGSWLNFAGGVAATVEQSSSRGLSQRRDDGSIVTLRDGALHHYEASLAALRTFSAARAAFLGDVAKHFRDVPGRVQAAPTKGYALLEKPRPDAVRRVVEALLLQGVRVLRTTAVVAVASARPFSGGPAENLTLPVGAYVVPADQPLHDLVRVLLEPDVPLDPAFLEADRARLAAGERSFIYDVTAWNMALAAGVPGYALTEVPGESLEPVDAVVRRTGEVLGPATATAYIVSSYEGESERVLGALARRRVVLRIAGFAFVHGGRSYPKGSIVILAERNGADLRDRLADAAKATGVSIVGVATMLTEAGFDLGSQKAKSFVEPRIALVGNQPASEYSFGGVRFFLEHELDYAYTPIHSWQIEKVDLAAYNVLVLPDGGDYARWLGEKGVERLKAWTEAGGTLVLLKGSGDFLRKGEKPWLKSKTTKPAKEVQPVRGAFVRLEAKASHWLTWGLGTDRIVGQLRGDLVHEPLGDDDGDNVVVFAAEDTVHLSGSMDPAQKKAFAAKLFAAVEKKGAGQVLIFADDLTVRANMPGLFPLMTHALLLGPTWRP